MIEFNQLIPGLWELNSEIEEAYRGYRFHWQNEIESEKYMRKHEDLKRKKEQLLKPIFGI